MRAATLVRQEPHQVSQNPQRRIRADHLASLVHQTRKRSLYPKQRLNPRKSNQPLKLKPNHTQVAILVHQVAPRASQAQALIRDRNPPPRLKQNHRLVEPLATLSQPKKAAEAVSLSRQVRSKQGAFSAFSQRRKTLAKLSQPKALRKISILATNRQGKHHRRLLQMIQRMHRRGHHLKSREENESANKSADTRTGGNEIT